MSGSLITVFILLAPLFYPRCASAVGTLVAVSSVTYGDVTGGQDICTAVAVGGDGSIIVTGQSRIAATFGCHTIKYSRNLGTVASYTFYGSGNTYGNAVTADTEGNIFVAGHMNSGTDDNWFVVKFDPDLDTVLSSATYINGGSTGDDDRALAAAVDSSGNLFVAGYKYVVGAGQYDYFVVKYSNNLDVISSATYAGAEEGNDIIYGLAVNKDDDVYVTGSEYKSSGDYKCFTIKYDNDLVAQSSVTYTGPEGYDTYGKDIEIDSEGNVFVLGYQHDSDIIDADMFIVKYNSSLVQKAYTDINIMAGEPRCFGYGMAIDRMDNIVTGGAYMDTLNHYGIMALRYDNDLTVISSAAYSGADNQQLLGMAVDSTGNIYAGGWSGTLIATGDYFLVKYNGLPVVTEISRRSAEQGETVDITITGANFLMGALPEFSSPDIDIKKTAWKDDDELKITIEIDKDAEPGKVNLTITSPDGCYYIIFNIFRILELVEEIIDEIDELVEDEGEITIIGSEEDRGTVNPDKKEPVQIYFKGKKDGKYTLRIFTMLGELVYDETKNSLKDGTFSWIPGDLASGIYIIHIEGPGISIQKKIAILR
ncbi:MAG: SBBP repeat-containing protein [Elusimicrobia bacterium]|nr:SBBP repeat-containing protein [Elusimicrobiota bacterium]